MNKHHKFLTLWLRKLCSVHFCFEWLSFPLLSIYHMHHGDLGNPPMKTDMKSPKMKIYGVDNVFLIHGMESKIWNLKIDYS